MIVERIPLSQMNPAPYNPRVELQPGDQEYDSLRRSIEKHGDVEPIVWNRRSGNIVGGHQRYNILKELGHDEVDVSVVDLDETEEKTLNLALNNIRGRWDGDKLRTILAELQEVADLAEVGFDELEVDRLLADTDLDIDAFFVDKEPKENPGGGEHAGEIQCPHCGEWFKPK